MAIVPPLSIPPRITCPLTPPSRYASSFGSIWRQFPYCFKITEYKNREDIVKLFNSQMTLGKKGILGSMTAIVYSCSSFPCRKKKSPSQTLYMVCGSMPGFWFFQARGRCRRASLSTPLQDKAIVPSTITSLGLKASGITGITGSTCRTVGTHAG